MYFSQQRSYTGEEPERFHKGDPRDRDHQHFEGIMTYWTEKTDALLLTAHRIYATFYAFQSTKRVLKRHLSHGPDV
jgi:hypothetical protein